MFQIGVADSTQTLAQLDEDPDDKNAKALDVDEKSCTDLTTYWLVG